MKTRFVSSTDSQAILDIYAYYIKNTVFTFEYETPSITEFSQRMETITSTLPYIVAIEDEQIIGYAYASKFHNRVAYQWSVELSIYLNPNIQHRGVGTILYKTLLSLLQRLGYQRVFACITIPNPASIAFHQKFGFSEVGTFHQCGYKHQQWLDVMWMELSIGQDAHPKPLKSVQCLKNEELSV